jgi:H/ACA ribonucleoprotein complex subunit 4
MKLRKTSHFGTLDPKVTGVLPIALNRACKLTGYFLGETKTYVGVMRVHEKISKEELEKAIKEKFLGKIKQTPPIKSSVKRQERVREIFYFKILEIEEKDVLFEISCEGGTYIRKICSDLGDYLKIGAHMLELRRIQAGIFSESNSFPMVSLYELEKAWEEYEKGNSEFLKKIIIPGEVITEIYPPIKIKSFSKKKILHGAPIYEKDLGEKISLKKEDSFVGFSDEEFIGIFKVIKEKEIFAKSLFTFQKNN